MNKMKNDPTFEAKFKEDPVKALENLMDIDLPNDAIDDIIAGIKAKIGINESGIMAAKAIISYREEQGPFSSIEDIMNVPGIKEGKYNKIKDDISISS